MIGLWAPCAAAAIDALSGRCLPGFHRWKPLYRLKDIRDAEPGEVIPSQRHVCVKCKATRSYK